MNYSKLSLLSLVLALGVLIPLLIYSTDKSSNCSSNPNVIALENIEVLNENSNENVLFANLNKGNALIFRIKESDCKDCVLNTINSIKQSFSKNSIDLNRLYVVLDDDLYPKHINFFKSFNEISSNSVFSNENFDLLFAKWTEKEKSFLFILESEKSIISTFYTPYLSNSAETEEYINCVINKYLEK